MKIEYVDTVEQLEQLCLKISQAEWIALDTEFLREKTYYPQFCLLQIATPDWVVCVDPLALDDMSELFNVINQPSIIKVLHSCRQDLEIFYKMTGEVTAPVFDTQLAAPLLGFQDNPGYAMLVSSFLNINLSKAHTRTDWSVRPLTQDQLQYAADDVIYLCQIYEKMTQKLEQMGRINWLENDFKALAKKELYMSSPNLAWTKIKGKNRLTGKQLSIVQLLSEWRETTAQTENRPKNWLIRDDLLLELAKLQPVNMTDLSNIRGINEKLIRRHGKTLCRLVAKGKTQAPVSLVDKNKAHKKNQKHEAILDVLTAVVRIRADEQSLNPNVLANRKQLEQLLFSEDDCHLLKGWRYGMVGKELQGLLNGDMSLKLSHDDVKVEN